MPRHILLNVAVSAVASTALVAALPLFADEPTANIAAAQAETPEFPNVDEAFADFNVSLFAIPDGESVAFYRRRIDEIEREWYRLVLPYAKKQEEFVRKNEPNRGVNLATSIVNTPPGFFHDGKDVVVAPVDSVPGRRAVALADLYGRLANAPELPLEVRGQYYGKWLNVSTASLRDKSPQERRDFYAKLLADEKAKSPLDVGRVISLNNVVSHWESHIKEDAESQKPLDRDAVEKLLDVPEGENSEFYQKRWKELNRAGFFLSKQEKKDETLQKRVLETAKNVMELRRKALDAEAAAYDRDAVKRLFDVPSGENAAFYLERYQETEKAMQQNSQLSESQKGRDLVALNVRLRNETLPEIAKRLAYADDLEPFQRFQYFQRWLYFADAEDIRDAIDAETVRDATSEVDACRKLYAKKALAEKLFDDAIAETRKSLPESERFHYSSSDRLPVSPEAQATFDEAFKEIAELANGGALPWSLGSSWAEWAASKALALQNRGYLELTTQLSKAVRDALADSENETDRRVLRELERQIRASEIIGSKIAVEGRNFDGTPFDWASYRGAPVLFVSGNAVSNLAPNCDLAFIPACVDAGLKVVYYDSDLESARRTAARNQEEVEQVQRLRAEGFDPTPKTPFAAVVVPAEGKTRGPGDWPYEHGIIWVKFGVLFDADGRVLATDPTPLASENAPKIADELRKLFPKVSVAESR